VFFGSHVFITGAGVDGAAVAIAAVAAVALLRYQLGTVKLLLACAIAGLVLSYTDGTTQLL
jgi:chromate transporter